MKKYRNVFCKSSAILFVMTLCGGQAFAGGLVELENAVFDSDSMSPTFSANISNPWWPLEVGDSWTYFKADGDECELIELQVMPGSPVKGADGIHVRVVQDNAYVNFQCSDDPNPLDHDADYVLVESTSDWYAQDIEGNIWYIGESTVALNYDPEGGEYVAWDDEDCDFINPSNPEECLDGNWEDGKNVLGDAPYYFDVSEAAERGIVMLNEPGKGEFYSQESYPDVAEDMGKVLNFKDIDPFFLEELELLGFVESDFEKCLMTKEWNPLDPGGIEHKYYCEDIGLVQVEENGGGKTAWEDVLNTNVSPPAP